MKRLLFPLILLLLTGCQRDAVLPEATSAAKEVYLKYADRKDLTVALIGDYRGYNAVMLQAQTNEGWLRLCGEFGVEPDLDAPAMDSVRVSSLAKAEIHLDSFHGTSDEALTHLLDSFMNVVAIQERMILDTLIVDTVRIDTLPTVTHRESYVQGVLVDSSTTVGDTALPVSNRLLHAAHSHGHIGYLIHGDSESLALWLFFYSNMEEFSQIIDNITINHTQQ